MLRGQCSTKSKLAEWPIFGPGVSSSGSGSKKFSYNSLKRMSTSDVGSNFRNVKKVPATSEAFCLMKFVLHVEAVQVLDRADSGSGLLLPERPIFGSTCDWTSWFCSAWSSTRSTELAAKVHQFACFAWLDVGGWSSCRHIRGRWSSGVI